MIIQDLSTVRTRIAPSPTGNLHIGTARTALFNYLFAKKHGGVFVLRIEDTDLERSDKKFEQDIFDGLRWLGIVADEGPEVGGPHTHYRQSERLEMYRKYLEKLLADGNAFYCFHTEQELEAERERQLTDKKSPIHNCGYRGLASNEAGEFLKEKPEHIIRFKTPPDRMLKFNDLIRGEINFDSNLLGDFSLAKNLDVPLYNFAVVIDDFEMKISHVIRGEDHISNTPKQMLVQEVLGFSQPEYAHLPLILGPDRSKLSKRHGTTSIREYQDQGYLPESLVNFMALLGWNPGTDQEIFALEELVRAFDISHVQKSGAVFNIEKLDWLNGEYIRKKSTEELTKLSLSFLETAGLRENQNSKFKDGYIEQIIALEQPRLKKLSEIGERINYFFKEPDYDKELLRWKNMTDQEILNSLQFSEELITSKIHSLEGAAKSKTDIERVFLEAIGEKEKGAILWPLRVALTGKKASPGPFDIIAILGSEEVLHRLDRAKKILQ